MQTPLLTLYAVPMTTPINYMDEFARCVVSPRYFIETYCKIYDGESGEWIPFVLWDEQHDVLNTVHEHNKVIALKARQLGMTWLLGDAYPLWLMLFRPAATVLLFSKRDDEAVYLLGSERFRGTYQHLPAWMKSQRTIVRDDAHVFALSNGSVARAFPTTAGDSYTATYALVDEADLVPNLSKLLLSVKPTVDMGGKLVLLSKADKSQPESLFKNIYRAAKAGESDGWQALFLPWWVRPGRTKDWYERERENTIRQTGSDDDMKENYPAEDVEALAPRMLDKRLPDVWLSECWEPRQPIPAKQLPDDAPAVQHLTVYALPEDGVKYVAGADTAEGLAGSDDSVTQIIRQDTGEQVAKISGKLTPTQQVLDTLAVSRWYNRAPVLVERNKDGAAFITEWSREGGDSLMRGLDKRAGWQTNAISKANLYNKAAEIIKDGGTVIHDFRTYTQLQSIELSTLKAPEGMHDDEAMAYVLALIAASRFVTSIPMVSLR